MLKLPVDSIIEKVHKETGLSTQEVKDKIKDKIKELDGLVSEEGAAFIVAAELGVQLLQDSIAKSYDIKSLKPGMRNVDVSGRVDSAFPVRTFVKNNETREVGSLRISDGTGDIRVALWDEKPQLIKEGKITRGSLLRIKNAQVKLNQKGEKELHVGSRGTIIVTSNGHPIPEFEEIKDAKITDLRDGLRASLLAEVVSLFEPKLYFVCPVCNKKVIPAPEGFLCSEHKQVTPLYNMLISLQLDDGTETMRAIAFGKTAEQICGIAAADIKNTPDVVETINSRLLGRTIKFVGRAKENKTFARTEFVVTSAELDINAKELAQKMMEGA